jgi:hypothetical protein
MRVCISCSTKLLDMVFFSCVHAGRQIHLGPVSNGHGTCPCALPAHGDQTKTNKEYAAALEAYPSREAYWRLLAEKLLNNRIDPHLREYAAGA